MVAPSALWTEMAAVSFHGQDYFDDRMFVLYLCRCTNKNLPDSVVETTIHHENPPPNALWCVATYRNVARYPMYRVDWFTEEKVARAYLEEVEPNTPRISLGGRPPSKPLAYAAYLEWKRQNQLQEYDYRKLYLPGGTSPKEMVLTRKRNHP